MRMFSRLARRSSALIAAAVVSVAVAGSASAGTVWGGNASATLNARHDGNTSSGGDGTTTTFNTTSPLSLNFGSTLGNGDTFSSTAKAGVAHKESSTNATAVLAAGTGVTQKDSVSASPESSLTLNFEFRWTIDDAGLGEPLNPSFSIPLAGTVGNGGFAKLTGKIEWDIIPFAIEGSTSRVELRNDWNINFYRDMAGAFTTTLNSPLPRFITTSQLGYLDTFILKGNLVFAVNNEEGPSEIALSADAEGGLFVGQPTGEVEAVPLPSAATAGLVLLGGLLSKRRKRELA